MWLGGVRGSLGGWDLILAPRKEVLRLSNQHLQIRGERGRLCVRLKSHQKSKVRKWTQIHYYSAHNWVVL